MRTLKVNCCISPNFTVSNRTSGQDANINGIVDAWKVPRYVDKGNFVCLVVEQSPASGKEVATDNKKFKLASSILT